MLNIPLEEYINSTNAKYIKALQKHLEDKNIKSPLFLFPYKYLTYKKGLIDEEFNHHIPIIYGKIISSYKKDHTLFMTVSNINHSKQKKFSIYFKGRLPSLLKVGGTYYFIGRITRQDNSLCMFFPRYQTKPFVERVHPVYEKINGCSEDKLKAILNLVIKDIPHMYAFSSPNIYVNSIRKIFSLIHNTIYCNDMSNIEGAWQQLKICEYICFLHGICEMNKRGMGDAKPLKYRFNLPMHLTTCQTKVIRSISKDLELHEPTVSFIQGDVGAGKTLVAFCAINKTLTNNFSGCFMAPTSILAHQHYTNYKKNFPEFNAFLVKGGVKSKKYLRELQTANEMPTIFFGTHALLYENLLNISLIVIDEQHKFGMEQRKILMNKHARSDILFLSATPIPRTLFMLQNAQMTLHTLLSSPFERNIETTLVRNKEDIREEIKDLSKTEKILWINSSIYEVNNNTQGVIKTYEFFKENNISTHLLHGQMKDEEKLKVLDNFHKGILVATICVETGMDIDHLNHIVIENAGAFGLATLHQLRGRIGRKGQKAKCILIESSDRDRLNILLKTNNGFEIAEMDLQQRGFGSFFEKQQWGNKSFLTGAFDEKLFAISQHIFKKQQYNVKLIESLKYFFYKLQDVAH